MFKYSKASENIRVRYTLAREKRNARSNRVYSCAFTANV